MTTIDTLLADLADVIDRASKLAAQMAETMAAPPSYWPERDGLFGGRALGDRMLWEGQWREVAYTTPCPDNDGRVHVGFTDKTWVCAAALDKVRIQKRHWNVPIPDDPLREFRLPGGRVGYATSYADEVEVGDWVQRCHGDPEWHLVKGVQRLDPPLLRITYDGLAHDWAPTDAIRIATAPVPDPEPYR